MLQGYPKEIIDATMRVEDRIARLAKLAHELDKKCLTHEERQEIKRAINYYSKDIIKDCAGLIT